MKVFIINCTFPLKPNFFILDEKINFHTNNNKNKIYSVLQSRTTCNHNDDNKLLLYIKRVLNFHDKILQIINYNYFVTDSTILKSSKWDFF